MRVAINPGHCPGLDPGACGLYSNEAELVAKVADVAAEDLRKIGYDVLVIQENYLGMICDAANEYSADVFCSIHANACSSHDAEGTETFFYPGSEFGYILAMSMQHQLLSTMHSRNRGIKEGRWTVISRTWMPACLCELDFIDNPEREKYLNEHIEEMGHAIARGITDFFVRMKDYVDETEVWD